jgi:hypothetical protein
MPVLTLWLADKATTKFSVVMALISSGLAMVMIMSTAEIPQMRYSHGLVVTACGAEQQV